MPYLIALAGAVAAICFFLIRARSAADMASELVDVAADVQAAARRFGFRRRANVHPVETVDDPKVAVATVAVAYLDLDGYPTDEAKGALLRALQSEFGVALREAEELAVLGRWLMGECRGAQPAIARATRRLYKLSGAEHLGALMGVVRQVTPADGLSDRQRDALDDIKRAMRIR